MLATGTPEDIMKVHTSYTGKFLKKHIELQKEHAANHPKSERKTVEVVSTEPVEPVPKVVKKKVVKKKVVKKKAVAKKKTGKKTGKKKSEGEVAL